jgi:hypothetical protein
VTEVYFPPKPISLLLNRFDKLVLRHVGARGLVSHGNRRQMRVTVLAFLA